MNETLYSCTFKFHKVVVNGPCLLDYLTIELILPVVLRSFAVDS